LNKDYPDLWVIDVIRFEENEFQHGFFALRPRKMSYLCIDLNLFETNMMLQLKISHGLADIIVIDKF
jgi:hypothetical protein